MAWAERRDFRPKLGPSERPKQEHHRSACRYNSCCKYARLGTKFNRRKFTPSAFTETIASVRLPARSSFSALPRLTIGVHARQAKGGERGEGGNREALRPLLPPPHRLYFRKLSCLRRSRWRRRRQTDSFLQTRWRARGSRWSAQAKRTSIQHKPLRNGYRVGDLLSILGFHRSNSVAYRLRSDIR